jgi:DNA mismatch endonuclease, patch repair protein
MVDVHNKATRSFNMSRIKATNTKPELTVQDFLRGKGYRIKTNDSSLPGTPDIVVSSQQTVIFVNGCYWHGHNGCRYFTVPSTRKEWWLNKILTTKKNDRRRHRELRKLGWRVIVIWECRLKAQARAQTLSRLTNLLGRYL